MHPETATEKRNAIDDFRILIRGLIDGLRFQERKLVVGLIKSFLSDRFWPDPDGRASIAGRRAGKVTNVHDRPETARSRHRKRGHWHCTYYDPFAISTSASKRTVGVAFYIDIGLGFKPNSNE